MHPHTGRPGRYRLVELTAFLASLQQGEAHAPVVASSGQGLAALLPPKHLGISAEPWYSRLDEAERGAMRSGGQQLMAVLMQYATRSNGGETFLQEGQRLAAHYGEASHRSGLTLIETLPRFPPRAPQHQGLRASRRRRWPACPTPTPGGSTTA